MMNAPAAIDAAAVKRRVISGYRFLRILMMRFLYGLLLFSDIMTQGCNICDRFFQKIFMWCRNHRYCDASEPAVPGQV